MSIDVKSLGNQILAAITASLPNLTGDQAASVTQQSMGLAQALAQIEADHAAGRIDDKTAQDLITAQSQTAQAALQADAGIAELDAGTAVRAGVSVLAGAAAASPGLAWIAPALQVVAGLGRPS